jgi:hypothetical protein
MEELRLRQEILFLLTRDVSYLPEDYPQVDIKKLLKKNDLQRMRIIKRLISQSINLLKEDEVSSKEQKSYIGKGQWCPPNCNNN